MGNTTLSVNTWYHVALQRDGRGEVSMWINGIKETATGTVTGAVNPPAELYIGRHGIASSQDFQGTLDEVKLTDQALGSGGFNLLLSSPNAQAATSTTSRPLSALIDPNPLRVGPGLFYVEGSGISHIAVEVYDLAGSRVFASDWQAGNTFEWQLRSDSGESLANGVYLYFIWIRRAIGSEMRSEVKTLVILR